MLKTIEGTYKDGQIQLAELPEEISDPVKVLVTFLDPENINSDKLCQLIAQLETITGISQGLEEVKQGKTRPMRDFIQEMQQKYDISG